MFDQKCFDLASSFLEDDEIFQKLPETRKEVYRKELAQTIQDTVEDYLIFEIHHPLKLS